MVPYANPGRADVVTYLGFLAGCLAFSAALVGLATARIRRVALGPGGAAGGRRAVVAVVDPRLVEAACARPARRSTLTRWRGGSGTVRGRR